MRQTEELDAEVEKCRSVWSSLVAGQARNEAFEARQEVSALRKHLVLVWIALIALTLKVCL